jgi:hypothetical protein
VTIHSIIPMEIIFAGIDQQTYDYIEMSIEGITMQVERAGLNQVKIIRLLSCKPNDYLNPAYMPGTLISYQPSFKS